MQGLSTNTHLRRNICSVFVVSVVNHVQNLRLYDLPMFTTRNFTVVLQDTPILVLDTLYPLEHPCSPWFYFSRMYSHSRYLKSQCINFITEMGKEIQSWVCYKPFGQSNLRPLNSYI